MKATRISAARTPRSYALTGAARLAAGAGNREAEPFVELGLRPTYHDIVDDAG